MGLDDGGIEMGFRQFRFEPVFTEGAKNPFPDPVLAPAIETSPDGVRVAEAFGQVRPGNAGLQDKQDGVHKQPIVFCRAPWIAGFPRQEKFDGRPLLVRQFMSPAHGFSSLEPPHTRETQTNSQYGMSIRPGEAAAWTDLGLHQLAESALVRMEEAVQGLPERTFVAKDAVE